MKKSFILLMTIVLASCISLQFPLESEYEKVYIGMPISDFLNKHSKIKNEYMDRNITIYSITYYQDKNGKAFVSSTSEVTYKKFYYFSDNKLERVDKGERAVDYRIRIDK